MQVKLIYGANEHDVHTDESSTINDLRDEAASLFSIDGDASAFVNGGAVDGSYTLSACDRVEFKKSTGRKG